MIIDPSQEESSICDTMINMIKFDNNKFLFHKNKGESVNNENVKKILELFEEKTE